MTTREHIWAMEDRQEAEAAIRARYTNPNTIRGAISEWARRRRRANNEPAPPTSTPRRGKTKDDMIDDYLKTTPLATIIARRKDLRRAQRQQERAELERRLAELDLCDREDDEEEEEAGDDESTRASSTNSNDEVLETDDEIAKDDNDDETQEEEDENTNCDFCGEPGHRILPECRHLLCRQHFDEHREDNVVECPICSTINDL